MSIEIDIQRITLLTGQSDEKTLSNVILDSGVE
jgi:hypothetical protein